MTEITRYYNESQAARRRACATTGELPPSAPQQSADPADIHVHQRTNTSGNACPEDGVGCAARGSEDESHERMLPAVSSGDDVGAQLHWPLSHQEFGSSTLGILIQVFLADSRSDTYQ